MGKRAGTDRVGILFVCLGNICRSPLAEGVFRHLARRRGLEQHFVIDSAGTSSYHAGDPPDKRSTAVARARGVELTGRSRQLVPSDFERFDFVITMDEEIHESVQRVRAANGSRAEVHLLREYDPEATSDLNVPDPYYGGPRGFEHVHDLVERSCAALLDTIARERGW